MLITTSLYHQDGAIRMKDIAVDTFGRYGVYIRRVRAGIERDLPKQQVTPDAVVLLLDFTLVVN